MTPLEILPEELPRGLDFLRSIELGSFEGAMQDVTRSTDLAYTSQESMTRNVEELTTRFPIARALRQRAGEAMRELQKLVIENQISQNSSDAEDRAHGDAVKKARMEVAKINGMFFMLRILVEIAECREPVE